MVVWGWFVTPFVSRWMPWPVSSLMPRIHIAALSVTARRRSGPGGLALLESGHLVDELLDMDAVAVVVATNDRTQRAHGVAVAAAL